MRNAAVRTGRLGSPRVRQAWREADADVSEAIDFCKYYADQAAA